MVITGLTRNQLIRKGPWVRIPPLPPESLPVVGFSGYWFFFFSSEKSPNHPALRQPKSASSCNPDVRKCLPSLKSRCDQAIPEFASYAHRSPKGAMRSYGGVVIPNVPQPVCIKQLRKALGNIVRLYQVPNLVDTYIRKIVLAVAASAQAAVFLLLFFQSELGLSFSEKIGVGWHGIVISSFFVAETPCISAICPRQTQKTDPAVAQADLSDEP